MIRVLGDRLMVEAPVDVEQEVGGIIIPKGVGEGMNEGWFVKCVGVGPGCKHVKKGDIVYLPRFSGHEVIDGNKKCIITKEDDIAGIVEE